MSLNKSKLNSAVKWFVQKIKDLGGRKKIKDEVDLAKTRSFKAFSKKMNIGAIYVHAYDAKTKKTLPFWDKIPLWTPLKLLPSHMLGLNFHFLPPLQRKAFLEDYHAYLTKVARGYGFENLEDVSPSQISVWGRDYITAAYLGAVKGPGNMLRNCVRTYLYGHIRSKILPVKINEWDNVASLILPNFQKQSNAQVYKAMYEQYKVTKDRLYVDPYIAR
jgi:hypothetical protein